VGTSGQAKKVIVRLAVPWDRPRVEAFCHDRGYRGFVSPEAAIVVAELGLDLVGLGRIQTEGGVLVLRGMRVDLPHRRSGIGTRLLELLVTAIATRACYCIPYSHLRGFYQRAGFIDHETDSAPGFLRARLNEYREAGNDVILMLRPGSRASSNLVSPSLFGGSRRAIVRSPHVA
jgi:GNAT superfamily N-acetyltransferase